MEINSDLLKTLPIVGNESYVDENGNPTKSANIYTDRIECHPSMIEKVMEGIRGFAYLSQGVQDEDDNGNSIP